MTPPGGWQFGDAVTTASPRTLTHYVATVDPDGTVRARCRRRRWPAAAVIAAPAGWPVCTACANMAATPDRVTTRRWVITPAGRAALARSA